MRSTWRNRSEQRQFRIAVLERARFQCEYPGCDTTDAANLVAHHDEPGNNDPATGRALCRPHHRVVDRYANDVIRTVAIIESTIVEDALREALDEAQTRVLGAVEASRNRSNPGG